MILVDSGPLVALVDKGDQYHAECRAASAHMHSRLATVWPVLTEAMYFLEDVPNGRESVWDFVQRGLIEVLSLDLKDVPRIRELMATYADLPMDLADAALVRVAEREGTREFFTIDKRDFAVYRLHGRVKPRVIP